ncbi:OmpA family protein [Myxococcota bacterium]|nr:OmpA family protein [Myxococcota bacterium]
MSVKIKISTLLILALLPINLMAQTDLRRFKPSPFPKCGLSQSGAETLSPMQTTLGLTLDYSYNPLVWRYPDNSYQSVIDHQTSATLHAAIGLIPGLDTGISLPLIYQNGSDTPELGDVSGAALGDVHIFSRLKILDYRRFGFSLATLLDIGLPTGNEKMFVGNSTFSVEPGLGVSIPGKTLKLYAALGFIIQGEETFAGLQSGNEYHGLAGVEYDLGITTTRSALLFEGEFFGDKFTPIAGEVRAALRNRIADDYIIEIGGGAGLTQGLGEPMARALVRFAWAPEPLDTDHDGLPDTIDQCPLVAEDFDGFEDSDGCPEVDNDKDGILDIHDQCPLDAEDFNGLDDEDGCPDFNSIDQDQDGIPDDIDQCIYEPEDIDGYMDRDGCPDPDNDFDGVLDEFDECDGEKETINGIDDNDGCPDVGEGRTTYVEDVKIEITETVLFETGSAIIKDESKLLLNEVALQILAHPEISLLRIEGHTDSHGAEEPNLYLSQDRADAVRTYLIERGIQSERIKAVGYGETMPIASNDTVRGRTMNRRVEFVILETDDFVMPSF